MFIIVYGHRSKAKSCAHFSVLPSSGMGPVFCLSVFQGCRRSVESVSGLSGSLNTVPLAKEPLISSSASQGGWGAVVASRWESPSSSLDGGCKTTWRRGSVGQATLLDVRTKPGLRSSSLFKGISHHTVQTWECRQGHLFLFCLFVHLSLPKPDSLSPGALQALQSRVFSHCPALSFCPF